MGAKQVHYKSNIELNARRRDRGELCMEKTVDRASRTESDDAQFLSERDVDRAKQAPDPFILNDVKPSIGRQGAGSTQRGCCDP
jgi:hypothetical protein